MGVDAAMESDPLAGQMQTHMKCHAVTRHCRGAKPFSWVENLAVKVCHEDAPVPEYDHGRSPEQLTGGQSTKIKVSMVDLDWQYNGELFLDQWAHDTSGRQERDATQRWACD